MKISMRDWTALLLDQSTGLDDWVDLLGNTVKDQYVKHAKENAAGNWPNRISHDLWRSILGKVRKEKNMVEVALQAGNEKAFYAKFVELGSSKYNVPFVGRFYLKRSFDLNNQKIKSVIEKKFDLFLNKRGF